ncbi:MAG: Outer membrane protein IcsA autotransporter [Candidatus Erwinia impunctatus]
MTSDSTSDDNYRTKGFTASLETGYTKPLMTFVTQGGRENTWLLRPQGQVIWSGVSADDHVEHNGDTIQGLGSDNLQTRLGLRLSLATKGRKQQQHNTLFEPYLEANWLYSNKQYGVKMANDALFL